MRSRNDEEDSESSDGTEVEAGRAESEDVKRRRKKNQFPRSGQRDALIAIPSHDPEIGNSKGSSDLRSKNRRFYPLRTLLNLPLFNFLGWMASSPGFFSLHGTLRFTKIRWICRIRRSLLLPIRSSILCVHDRGTMIFQNHEKIYLHPAMLSRRPRSFAPLFSNRGCCSREGKKTTAQRRISSRNNAFSHSFCAFAPAGGSSVEKRGSRAFQNVAMPQDSCFQT